MSVDLTKGATVELVKTLSDDLRTKDDNTKYSSAGAAMRDKANVNGYYEDLVSGGTDQIISSVFEEDSEPYLFRTSGGSMDIGDREEDCIVGGTVAWNQLIQNGNFADTSVWSKSATITFTVNNNIGTITTNADGDKFMEQRFTDNVPVGHKVLYTFDVKTDAIPSGESSVTVAQFFRGWAGSVDGIQVYNTDWKNISKIANIVAPAGDNARYVMLRLYCQKTTVTNHYKNVGVFDLTQMFGSTIADYIYSLETATAGAGVAWFKKLFPKPYYEYNAGELLSVEGLQSHDMVGFNLWDEEYQFGYYDANGVFHERTSQGEIASKNMIPVLPNTTYYFHIGTSVNRYVCYYDADGNIISQSGLGGSDTTFTTPSNCHYINFNAGANYGTTYKNDICINLHWDGERDGEYEPYVKHSYPLDDSLTLRGIPKLDSNNKMYYDGDVYHADGTVTRRYGVIMLNGTENWSLISATTVGKFYTQCYSLVKVTNYKKSIICDKLGTGSNGYSSDFVDTPYMITGYADNNMSYPNQNWLYVRLPDDIDTSAKAKAWFASNPTTVVYELATPTTEEAEPYTNPQIVDDFGTEEYVTDSIVPVGHVTKYMPNLKAKLEMAPDSPSDNGDYIVRHTNGQNEYVPLVIPTELPAMPTGTDGSYKLVCTVTNGVATMSWETNE